jgi:hypothetical protein
MEFIATDPAAFRATLKEAGFYAEWQGKFGDEAWGVLEASVGGLARSSRAAVPPLGSGDVGR